MLLFFAEVGALISVALACHVQYNLESTASCASCTRSRAFQYAL